VIGQRRLEHINYPQNRITDHRIGLTLYSLDNIVNDGTLNLILDPLIANAQAEAIKEAGL